MQHPPGIGCPACAEVYRWDTYHLIAAGLGGGKGVADSVSEHSAIFLTLTPRSFGVVHTPPDRTGRPGTGHHRLGVGAALEQEPGLSAQLHRYVPSRMEQLPTGRLTVSVRHRDLHVPGDT